MSVPPQVITVLECEVWIETVTKEICVSLAFEGSRSSINLECFLQWCILIRLPSSLHGGRVY